MAYSPTVTRSEADSGRAERSGAVVIIGGGPAGALCASLVRRGPVPRPVLVLEKARFPRHRVGETTVPHWGPILARAGVLERAARETALRKVGILLRWGDGEDVWTTDFRDLTDQTTPPGGYQIQRGAFDALLLDHARTLGAEVREEATVTAVEQLDSAGVVVRWREGDAAHEVVAAHVVDASGPARLLSRLWAIPCERFEDMNNYAVWGYWEGSGIAGHGDAPLPADQRWTTISRCDAGWVWHIPITDRITSVGLVTTKETRREGGADLESFYRDAVAGAAPVGRLLGSARLLDAEPGLGDARLQVMDYWSYRLERVCGPGWWVVGDAAMFVDPILASGLQWAAISANMAANAIATDVADPDALRRSYQQTFAAHTANYHDLARVWYRANCGRDSPHWRRKAAQLREHAGTAASEDPDAFIALGLRIASDPRDVAVATRPSTILLEEFFPWIAAPRLFPVAGAGAPEYATIRDIHQARAVTRRSVMERWRRLALGRVRPRDLVWTVEESYYTSASLDRWVLLPQAVIQGPGAEDAARLRFPAFPETRALLAGLGGEDPMAAVIRAIAPGDAGSPTPGREARVRAMAELLLHLELLGRLEAAGEPPPPPMLRGHPLVRALIQPLLVAVGRACRVHLAFDWLAEAAVARIESDEQTHVLHFGDDRVPFAGEILVSAGGTDVRAAEGTHFPAELLRRLDAALRRRQTGGPHPWDGTLALLGSAFEVRYAPGGTLVIRPDRPRRLLAINGSPRVGGNCDVLTDALLDAARDAGAETRTLLLRDLRVRPCLGTFACNGVGRCVSQADDDFNGALAEVLAADALVFATPSYWSAPSAQLKAFLDRLVSAVDWSFAQRPTAFRSRLRGKQAVLLVAQDARERGGADALAEFFRLFFRDVSLVPAGDVVLTDAPHAGPSPEAPGRPAALAAAAALGAALAAGAVVDARVGQP